MTNKVKREKMLKALVIVISIILAITMIVLFSIQTMQRRKYLLDNPPSYSFIEEDLEVDLCTLDVRVLEDEQNDDVVLYKVWANNAVWKVTYYAKYLMGEYWEKHDVTFVGYMSEEEANEILYGTAVEIAKTV